jgi:hypothetical protein
MVTSKDFKFDDDTGVMEVYGIKIAYEFFKQIGLDGVPLNAPFKIIKRHDGVVTVQIIRHDEHIY